jgi:hypothetical protein
MAAARDAIAYAGDDECKCREGSGAARKRAFEFGHETPARSSAAAGTRRPRHWCETLSFSH